MKFYDGSGNLVLDTESAVSLKDFNDFYLTEVYTEDGTKYVKANDVSSSESDAYLHEALRGIDRIVAAELRDNDMLLEKAWDDALETLTVEYAISDCKALQGFISEEDIRPVVFDCVQDVARTQLQLDMSCSVPDDYDDCDCDDYNDYD